MKFLIFTKPLANMQPGDLADLARQRGADGLDLCVRQGHPVQPADLATTLPRTAAIVRDQGAPIEMVSAPPDLTDPQSPLALTLCQGMQQAGIGLLKIGYFPFQPDKHDYASALERARDRLAQWADLAKAHNLTACYHSHVTHLGASAGMLVDLLDGLPVEHLAAYLDPAQLILQGEGLAAAMAMLHGRARVAAVGLKDVLITRPATGGRASQWVFPGSGMVDWPKAAQAISRSGFDGVMSMHVLMHPTSNDRLEEAAAEVRHYKQTFQGDR